MPEEERTDFYFAEGRTGTEGSANDGALRLDSGTDGVDEYTVDYTATMGFENRWVNTHGGPSGYPDLTENDTKGLTYTTPPLDEDLEVTGHPVVNLWVTSSADDGDFFVYLEEVDAEGRSDYVSEGVLRASHRAVREVPFDDFGLPHHRSNEKDAEPLPDHPVQLAIDLHPSSNVFDAGHRLRITITGADADNNLTPKRSPAPRVRLYRDGERRSHVTLPVIPSARRATRE